MQANIVRGEVQLRRLAKERLCSYKESACFFVMAKHNAGATIKLLGEDQAGFVGLILHGRHQHIVHFRQCAQCIEQFRVA